MCLNVSPHTYVFPRTYVFPLTHIPRYCMNIEQPERDTKKHTGDMFELLRARFTHIVRAIFLWRSCHMTLSVSFVPHHIVRVVRSTLLARLVWCFHVCTHTHIDISPTFDLIRLVTHTNIPFSNISHEMWLSDTFCPHFSMVMLPHPLNVELGCMHACINVELGIILILWMCN